MSYFPNPRPPVVLAPGEGRSLVGPTGAPMFIKATGDETAGAYSAIEYSHAAGAPGPPVHVHYQHEEAFFVIEGELTLLVGDQSVTIGPGGFGLVPRGTPHQPSNRGTVSTRFIFIASPPMEGFFVEMEQLLAAGQGRPKSADIIALGRRWDSTFVDLDPLGSTTMHNEHKP